MLNKENLLFAATLILMIAVLAAFCLYFGLAD